MFEGFRAIKEHHDVGVPLAQPVRLMPFRIVIEHETKAFGCLEDKAPDGGPTRRR